MKTANANGIPFRHDKFRSKNTRGYQFPEEMRDAGQAFGGAAAMSNKDVQNFANALDRLLQVLQAKVVESGLG